MDNSPLPFHLTICFGDSFCVGFCTSASSTLTDVSMLLNGGAVIYLTNSLQWTFQLFARKNISVKTLVHSICFLFFSFFLFFFLVVLGISHALCMLNNQSTTKLHPQPFFWWGGGWTQVLCLEPLHQPFFVIFFFSRTICPGWLWTEILPISASWAAKIIDVSHQCPTPCLFFCSTGAWTLHLEPFH
jgi:hypothetical protein